VADNSRGILTERLDHAQVVRDMLRHPVLVNPRWRRRATATAHVDRRRAVARIGKRMKLMPPRVPGFGKAVDHQDERTLARLDEVDSNTVGYYDAVFEFSHLCRLLSEVAELYLRSARICMAPSCAKKLRFRSRGGG
jgi:hypothetical protein